MAQDRADDSGLRRSVRRAVGDAFDATVGRVTSTVGEAALDVTGATAQQVIEELEPYLVEEAVPRIVAGITPFLAQTVVPEVLEGVHEHLVEVTVPDVVDGVTEHLVEVTVPDIVAGITPRLVSELIPRILGELRPYLTDELVPGIVEAMLPQITASVAPDVVDALLPKIRDEVAPDLVDSLLPKIEQQVAPRLVDALLPKIRDEVAPDLVDSLLPKIEQQVAPRLVDALLPKIRAEVVPVILDDIVDDPRIRDLIREQSQGLFLDALESLRENLADADNLVERIGRRILRQPPRPEPESVLAIVLDATRGGRAAPTRRPLDEFADRRLEWRHSPAPPAPPGREFAYAGAVTRLLGLAVDVSLVGWLLTQGVSALVNLIGAVLNPAPPWLTAVLAGIASSLVPLYLAICWRFGGRSVGSWLLGTRVCTADGRNVGLVRGLVRAWTGLLGFVIFAVTAVISLVDPRRRTLLDRLLNTEVRYVVPDDQQHRYIREAMEPARERERAARAIAALESYEASARDGSPDTPGTTAA
jgi:uncharacterized RDD family membrane protein YckC